jgi:hypothetical protein
VFEYFHCNKYQKAASERQRRNAEAERDELQDEMGTNAAGRLVEVVHNTVKILSRLYKIGSNEINKSFTVRNMIFELVEK